MNLKDKLSLVSLFLIFAVLTGCGTLLNNEPNASFVQPSSESDQSVEEPRQENMPIWVEWLANHWEGDAEKWLDSASKEGVDVELWLRENETYGENVKCWSIDSALENCGDISIAYEQFITDKEEWRKIGEELIEKMVIELSTENEKFSFCFNEVESVNVVVEWSEKQQNWIGYANGNVNFNGIILPIGSTAPGRYVRIVFGTFKIEDEGNQYSLRWLPSDIDI